MDIAVLAVVIIFVCLGGTYAGVRLYFHFWGRKL